MDHDQIEFIRVHGVKRLPPGPVVKMSWHTRNDRSEEETLAELSHGFEPLPGPTADDGKRVDWSAPPGKDRQERAAAMRRVFYAQRGRLDGRRMRAANQKS